MVRIVLAVLVAFSGTAMLGLLQAEHWPSGLFFLAFTPFLLAAGFIMNPALQRYSRKRRARRAAH
jgi:hypothetical protein